MAVEKTNDKVMDRVIQILLSIHKGDHRNIKRLCAKHVLWKCGCYYGSGAEDNMAIRMITDMIAPETITRFVRCGHYVQHLKGNGWLVAGRYQIEYVSGIELRTKEFEYTMVLADGIGEFIQIDFQHVPTKIYEIIAINEAVHYLSEKEILYVEALSDHILWHCRNKMVEAVGTLKHLEQELSEEFVRVHRSYIINKNLITSIQRCSVTMVNGCNIPIPYKKYVNVKEKLMRHSASLTGY